MPRKKINSEYFEFWSLLVVFFLCFILLGSGSKGKTASKADIHNTHVRGRNQLGLDDLPAKNTQHRHNTTQTQTEAGSQQSELYHKHTYVRAQPQT